MEKQKNIFGLDELIVGMKVGITEEARTELSLPKNLEYEIDELLAVEVDYRVILKSSGMPDNWIQFFRESQLIKAEKNGEDLPF